MFAGSLWAPFAKTGTHSRAHQDILIVNLAQLEGAEDIAMAANPQTIIMITLQMR